MKIAFLNQFTPAETLLLKYDFDIDSKEIYHHTLIDLVLKNVIKLELKEHVNNHKLKYPFLSYNKDIIYATKIHEKSFIDVFSNVPTFYFKDYIQDFLKTQSNSKKIKIDLIQNRLSQYFNQSVVDAIINSYSKNSHAEKLAHQINMEITAINNYVITTKDYSVLDDIYGNILFLHPSLIKRTIPRWRNQFNRVNKSDSSFDAIDMIDLFPNNAINEFDLFGGGSFGGAGANSIWDSFDISDIID